MAGYPYADYAKNVKHWFEQLPTDIFHPQTLNSNSSPSHNYDPVRDSLSIRNTYSSDAASNMAEETATSSRILRDQTPYPGDAYQQHTLRSIALASTALDIGTSFGTLREQTPYGSIVCRPTTLGSNVYSSIEDNTAPAIGIQRENTPYPDTVYCKDTFVSNAVTTGVDVGVRTGTRVYAAEEVEDAMSVLLATGHHIVSNKSGFAFPTPSRREATPYPRHSPTPSSTALSDAPPSEFDQPPHPSLSRRASALSLPDAPPTTTPTRRSSMSKPGNKIPKLHRKVYFDESKNTELPGPPVEHCLLPHAYSRCKKFVLSYADIDGINDENRSKNTPPMFALRPPPYLSTGEKDKYAMLIQRAFPTHPQPRPRPHLIKEE